MAQVNDDTDYRALYSKEHLGAWDLPDGRDAVVTIERVEAKELRAPTKPGGIEIKPILFFVGKSKSMIVNATNGKILASLYGTKIGQWKGKRIALYKATTNGPSGTMVDCIRIRPQAPQSKKSAPEPESIEAALGDDGAE